MQRLFVFSPNLFLFATQQIEGQCYVFKSMDVSTARTDEDASIYLSLNI